MQRPPVKLTLAWLIITVIVYAIFYKWLDIPFMYFISHDYQTNFYSFSKILKLIFTPELWFLVGVICCIYVWSANKNPKLRFKEYVLPFGINLVFAFILTFIIKICLARYRPIELFNNNLYGFHYFSLSSNSNSTPSGHTVMAFALFFTFARFFKKTLITTLCMIIPILVALSRLALADHYTSDVILAAYVGIISVFWGEWIRMRFFTEIKPALHVKSN